MSKGAPKKQEITDFDLKEEFQSLLDSLEKYQAKIPQEIVEDILKEVGVETSDPKVVKFIGAAADYFISDINESILSLNPLPKTKESANQQMEEEKEKDKPADKASIKAVRSTKDKNLMMKTFTCNSLIGVLNEKGIKMSKPAYSANSKLINDLVDQRSNMKEES